MKYITMLIFIAGACTACLAQTNSPAVIIASGNFTQGTEVSLSWTLGESLVESYGEEDLMLLQGFQEVEAFPVAIDEYSFEGAGVLVYPTRTRNIVNVIIPGDISESYTGEFIDLSGKVVSVIELPANHNEISLGDFSCGIYLLKINNEAYPVMETKIIKF